MSEPTANDVLRSYFERWRRLEEEKGRVSEDLKELFLEAKQQGFNTKAMRVVFRDKEKLDNEDGADRADRQEFEALVELYRASLDAPRARPAPAHEKRLKNLESGVAREVRTAALASPAADAGNRDDCASPPAGSGSDEMPATNSHSAPSSPQVAEQTGAVVPPPSAAPVTQSKTLSKADQIRLLRPNCQFPGEDRCGGSGRQHCRSCERAARESEAA